jgi:NDP-sugar pyrophosphorylase family protein
LIERSETFVALVNNGYWIDIGTIEKYAQVHRDIMDGRFRAAPFAGLAGRVWTSPEARVEEGAVLDAPCFVDAGAVVKSGARIGPYGVVGKQCHVMENSVVEDSIVWANSRVGPDAVVRGSVLGRHCYVGANASVEGGAVLGDRSVVTDFSRL